MVEPDNNVENLRELIETRLSDLQAQLDRRIETEQREINLEVNHLKDLIEAQDRRVALAIQAARREADITQEASKEAIGKAEVAMTRRLDLLNEFRAQMADEAQKYALRERVDAQFGELMRRVEKLLPREVYEQTVEAWTIWRNSVDNAIATRQGADLQQAKTQQQLQPWQIWAAGAVVTIILATIVILINLLTSNP